MQVKWTKAEDDACFELLKQEANARFSPHINHVYASGMLYFKGQAGVQTGEYMEAVLVRECVGIWALRAPSESQRRHETPKILIKIRDSVTQGACGFQTADLAWKWFKLFPFRSGADIAVVSNTRVVCS